MVGEGEGEQGEQRRRNGEAVEVGGGGGGGGGDLLQDVLLLEEEDGVGEDQRGVQFGGEWEILCGGK